MTAPTNRRILRLRVDNTRLQARRHLLDTARKAAKESRILDRQADLDATLARIAEAQQALRAAQDQERTAGEAVDAARAEAEWMLGDRFIVEANRTYLILDVADADTGERVRRQMTAEERKQWTAREADRQPAVVEQSAHLRAAQHAVAACRDDLAVAERSFAAARSQLAAATAYLTALSGALTGD